VGGGVVGGRGYYFGYPRNYAYPPPAPYYYLDSYAPAPGATYGFTIIGPCTQGGVIYRPDVWQQTAPVYPPAYR
jgi:hypothetical protein